jgi:hypothetical protein
LDVLPVKTQQLLDRSVRPQVAKARSTVVHRVVHPVAGDGRGQVLHASILDGHTFNLNAVLPVPDTGAAEEAALFLVRGREHHRVPATMRRVGPDEIQIEATALLGPLPDGIDLPTGRWRPRVLITADGRPARGYDLEGPLTPAAAGGPTHSPSASALTGRRFHIRLSPLGLLRVAVASAQTHAQVVRFELGHGGASLTFRIVGSRPAGQVSLELTREGATAAAPARSAGEDLLACEIPFDAMAGGPPGTEQVWHLHAKLPDGTRLALGRELDIMRMPRRTFRLRSLLVATQGGAFVRVRPHYSARHQFRIACTLVSSDRAGAAS